MTKLYHERMACCMYSTSRFFLPVILWCITQFFSNASQAQCNNITWGGEICCDQSGIGPYDPALIYNTSSPTGGSGEIQFLWLAKNATSDWEWFTVYEGSNDCFDPTTICETTVYRRCSRRSGCSSWDGESNDVTVEVSGGCDPCSDYLGTPALENRVSQGLISLYSFQNGAGNVIEDISGVGLPMDLTIDNPSNTTWLPNSGLTIHTPTIIKTSSAATKLYNALQGANAFSFEAWIKPDSDAQGGPARIATMSSSTSQRNFMLGQNNDKYLMRLRTDDGSGDNNGLPNLNSPSNAVHDDFAQHIVYTMTSSGQEKMYLNGDLIATGTRSGGFTNWSSSMFFALGNEMSLDRAWLGRIYLVAIYNQELDVNEVQQNYEAAFPGYCSLTCNAAIHELVINNTDASAPAFVIHDGDSYDLQDFPTNWNVEAMLLGDESESVRFTWGGDIDQTNIENVYPFRSFGGDNNPINLGVGTYTLTVEVFSEDGAVGIPCDTQTISFSITNEIPCVNIESVCEIGQTDAGHAVWFNSSLASAIGCSNQNFIPASGCILTKYSDGTLKVEGTMQNAAQSNKKFTFITWYKLRRNWEEWSAIPHPTAPSGFREAKLDAGTTITIVDEYLGWEYYELDESKPHSITGINGLSGLNLNVTHRPEDLRYGAQYGTRASLQSEGLGFSAWINLDGTYNSTSINDHGDYNFDINNCIDGNEFQATLTGIIQPDCNNLCQGAATVSATGGLGVYTYQWSNGMSTASVTNLCPGIYTCVVSSEGCSQTLTLTLSEPQCAASLGDFVWFDANWNGIQDPEESGVQGVNVSLYACGGALLATQATDVNGNYLFEDLIPGNSYNLVFSNIPNGYLFTAANSGSDEALDSDADFESGQTVCVTLGSNDTYLDIDAGLITCPQPVLVSEFESWINIDCGMALPDIPVMQFMDPFYGVINAEFSEVFEADTCLGRYIRTWIAQNPCGMIASATQTIDVIDTTPPVLYGIPDNMVIDCNDPVEDAVVFAIDNCDAELIVSIHVETSADDCGMVMVRTWSTTDDCGNATSASQTTHIHDLLPPVAVDEPLDIQASCSDIPPPAVVEFTDMCDAEIDTEYSEEVVSLDNCTYEIIRNWIGRDDCGNETLVSQTITVVDNQNPVIVSSPEAELVIQCDQIPPDANVEFQDACDDELAIQFFTGISNESSCGYDIERTWIATDDCGNTTEFFQLIHVQDNQAPILSGVPQNEVVACGEIPLPAEVVATDLCDANIEVLFSEEIEEVTCGYILTRTWSATDDCGNHAFAQQIITVADIIAPEVIYVPQDMTFDCGEVIPDWNPIFTDNCDSELNIVFESDTVYSDCGLSIVKTWTAIDNCGNAVEAVHTCNIIDSTDPELIGVPEHITVSCNSIPAVANVTVSDNCDLEPSVYFSEVLSSGCPSVLTRTWIAVDQCGNEATAYQFITLLDTTPPVFAAPEDMVVDCADIPSVAQLIAEDDCSGEIVPEFIQSESNFTDCGYDIIRTWIATDACGNSFSDSQIIHVSDFTPPNILDVPSDITVQCGEIPEWPIVFAEDFCSQVQLATSEVIEANCPMLITRTWTATDACGNETSMSQQILVVDETPPVLFNIPADITIECDEDMPGFSMEVFATDNCSDLISLDFYDDVEVFACGQMITRTYVAEDECGNASSASQIILIVDETLPIFANTPEDIMVPCDNIPAPEEMVATDNCDTDLEYNYSESVTGGGCQVQIKRIWTATDDCGNMAVVTQVLTLTDNIPPVFLPYEPFVQMQCDEIDNYVLPAVDNCDEEVDVSILEELTFSGSCYGTLQRTYQAMDDCGNTSTVVQLIDIIDTTPPVLNNLPDDTKVDCSELPLSWPDVFATDNCSEDLVVQLSETQSQEQCPFILTRTWVVEDACGNTTSYSQEIEVTQFLPPTVFMNTFPNPAGGGTLKVQLNIPQTGFVNARIYDVTGKETLVLMNGMAEAQVLYDWQISTIDMGSGNYTLKVIVDGAVYTDRITIINN